MTPERIVEQFYGQTFSSSQEVRAWLLKGIASAISAEREACAQIASKLGDSLSGDCTYRNGMDPETGEQLCARRDGCQCDEIIDCAYAIAGKIRNRATT